MLFRKRLLTKTKFSFTWNWKTTPKLLAIILAFALVCYFNLLNSVGITAEHQSAHQFNDRYQFYHNRVQLWNEGRCLDSLDGTNLVVAFCDPDQEQSFSLTADHKLVHDRTGKCVIYNSFQFNTPLILMNCNEETIKNEFRSVNNSYLYTEETFENLEHLCITPMSTYRIGRADGFRERDPRLKSPCLNDSLGITKCDDIASRIVLIEELVFQEDRRLLKNLLIPPNDPDCDFKACGLNKQTPPIQMLLPNEIERCTKPWECVTLVTKTARRPLLVVRLAQSVRESYGFDLPFVAYDDGPDDYSGDIKQLISQYPLLNYVVGEDEDYGISEGRNRALALVRTKYFFLLDDDVLLLNTTDIRTMIDILDTTDATLVGAQYLKRGNFAGLIKFGYFNDPKRTRKMGLFPGACDKMNRVVPSFPGCIQCDTNANVFLARTASVKAIGGWDPEIKVFEHRDLFVKMKAAGLKVALCHRIRVLHDRPEDGMPEQAEGYDEKRWRLKVGTYRRFIKRFQNRFNFQAMFVLPKQEVDEQGNVTVHSAAVRKGQFC